MHAHDSCAGSTAEFTVCFVALQRNTGAAAAPTQFDATLH